MSWMQKNYDSKRHTLYIPENIEKYKGSIPLVLRSGLEKKFASWCDRTNSVIYWACEHIDIPYFNPIKKRNARYYPDFVIKVRTNEGEKIFIIEIKPARETVKPKITRRKSLITEQKTYMVNMSKWKACIDYCSKYGYIFKIVTDQTLERFK